jgi:hypothetical protein
VEQDYIVDDGLVERLLAALSDALRRTRKDPFGTPVTVAEIYQDLVPYRSVRTALGFQMNADYEHTVLRLLAGEGDLARLEPQEAREELRSELDMPNPNVGLFRKFAACDVWVLRYDLTLGAGDTAGSPPAAEETPARMPERQAQSGGEPQSHEEPREWMSQSQLAYAANPVEPEPALDDLPDLELENELVAADQEDEAAAVRGDALIWAEPEPAGEWDAAEGELLLDEEVQDRPTESDTSEEPASAGSTEPRQQPEAAVMFDSSQSQGSVATAHAGGSCAFCQGSLPGGRVVRFCPFCGKDQTLKPCGSCREPLDPSWKFCIGCGSQQS